MDLVEKATIAAIVWPFSRVKRAPRESGRIRPCQGRRGCVYWIPLAIQQGYGSPEVDRTTPRVVKSVVSDDGLQTHLHVEGLVQGHVHDFDLQRIRSAEGNKLVHVNAYYTLNEVPTD